MAEAPSKLGPFVSPLRVTQAIMAKANGGQQQILHANISDPHSDRPRPEHGHWLIPPEIWDPLNREFHFDYDPCPNPRPVGYDGLEAEWGRSNWVNPPFWAGVTAWVRKAIAESKLGKVCVVILPMDAWVSLFIDTMGRKLLGPYGEIRHLGYHDWIHTHTGRRKKSARPSVLFILRGERSESR